MICYAEQNNQMKPAKGISGSPPICVAALVGFFIGDAIMPTKSQPSTKRSNARSGLYKQAINLCCNPTCKFGYVLKVHHIIPLSKGGEDTFENMIVLCSDCHLGGSKKLHLPSRTKQIRLRTYKFYIEKLELGFCSDEMSSEKFEEKLKNLVKVENKP